MQLHQVDGSLRSKAGKMYRIAAKLFEPLLNKAQQIHRHAYGIGAWSGAIADKTAGVVILTHGDFETDFAGGKVIDDDIAFALALMFVGSLLLMSRWNVREWAESDPLRGIYEGMEEYWISYMKWMGTIAGSILISVGVLLVCRSLVRRFLGG